MKLSLVAMAPVLFLAGAAHAQDLPESEWQFAASAQGGIAVIAKDEATLTVHNDCESLAIHYSFPPDDLDPAFAERDQVDITMVRESGPVAYAQDVPLFINEGRLTVFLFTDADSGFIRNLQIANTITVGLSRDAEARGPIKNQTTFSAAGSTAAIGKVLASCDNPQEAEVPADDPVPQEEQTEDHGWAVEVGALGLPLLMAQKDGAGLSLGCRRDRSGDYQLSYEFSADLLAPELFGKAVQLRLTSTSGAILVLDALAEPYDGSMGFYLNLAPNGEVTKFFRKATGAIAVSLSATGNSEQFNTVAYSAQGLKGQFTEFQSMCEAAAG